MSREQDRQFIRNFVAVIVGLVVTTAVLIGVAASLYDGNMEARRELDAERAAANLKPVGEVRVATKDQSGASDGASDAASEAASGGGDTAAQASEAEADTAQAEDDSQPATDVETAAAEAQRSGEAVAMQVCAACHRGGVLGAPKFGDGDAWAPRADKGMGTLVDHAANGFNNMPPQKGSASREEIRRATVWMLEDAGVSVPE